MPLHATFKQPQIAIWTKEKIKALQLAVGKTSKGRQPVFPARVLLLAIINVCQPANECGKKNCVGEIKALAAVCVAAYKGAGPETCRVLLRWGSPDSIPGKVR